MEINTNSGVVSVNKNSNYGKWLKGWTDANAFSGSQTLEEVWKRCSWNKPNGCSWYAYGYIMGKEFIHYRFMEKSSYRVNNN